MTVYNRLKMELSNQQYFPEEQYVQFLIENNLKPTDDYDKKVMQKDLLFAVVDILEAVANDIDLMTGVSTDFANLGEAYQFIEARIQNVKDKIAAIPDEDEDYSMFSLMYTRGHAVNGSRPSSNITGTCKHTGMTKEDIEDIWNSDKDYGYDSEVDNMFK